jgi:hypothetical protein
MVGVGFKRVVEFSGSLERKEPGPRALSTVSCSYGCGGDTRLGRLPGGVQTA